jgi:hypothetical protein
MPYGDRTLRRGGTHGNEEGRASGSTYLSPYTRFCQYKDGCWLRRVDGSPCSQPLTKLSKASLRSYRLGMNFQRLMPCMIQDLSCIRGGHQYLMDKNDTKHIERKFNF